MEEIWMYHPYLKFTMVSNLGRVKNVKPYAEQKSTKYKERSGKSREKILAITIQPNNGYCYVHIQVDGKSKGFRVHRLVAETFIPNYENKPYVNHIDGDKTNNCVDNLEWCTAKENTQHAMHNGLMNTDEHWEKVKDKMGKNHIKRPVVLYDKLSGEFIIRFDSIKECSDWFIDMGYSQGTEKTTKTNIQDVLSGRRKSIYGFKIYYE